MSKKGSRTTQFNHPLGVKAEPPEVFVGPGVDPQAAAYAAGMAARRTEAARKKGGLPKYSQPVGGGPTPPIPRLDAPHQEGMTMAEQAEHINQPSQHAMVQNALAEQPTQSIVEPPLSPESILAAQNAMLGRPPQPAHLGIRPTDMLPEQAFQDPAFRQGAGSAFAASQPYLAAKYGVIRDGIHISPQALSGNQPPPHQRAGPSQETIAGIAALNEAQKAAQRAQAQKPTEPMESKEEEEEVDEGGPVPAGEERKRIEESINKMDSFAYDALRQQMERDILNNDDQRDIIRGRCKPLDIEELILHNRVKQDVPVVPPSSTSRGFVITFSSISGEEDLALKQILMEESRSLEVTDRYLLDKFAFMTIACGLVAINSNPAPTHLDENGNFSKELFWKKFEWVMKRPLHMLSSIGINHTWFEMDVRKLFVAGKLGNG